MLAAGDYLTGIAPQPGSVQDTLQSYFGNLHNGDVAMADGDSIKAALEMNGYQAGGALVSWGVLQDAGDAFGDVLGQIGH